MTRARDLNALLGSRICHDLISPLGAIGNGVELLAMSGAVQCPEMDLITESVESANARIRFFRISYGATTPDQHVASSEVVSILTDIAGRGRMAYHWNPTEDAPRAAVKLIFLLIQCLESAMPRGGTVTVDTDYGSWRITGSAERLHIDPALWSLLVDPEGDVDFKAADVHFPLAGEAARRSGVTLHTDLGDNRIVARF